jgi:Fe-S-cluster-containing hydrogenase component 2/CRP-like cAMP-binding protein
MAPPTIPLERLNDLPLTRGLPHDVLTAIQPNLLDVRFTAGTVILKAGDYLDGLYYIVAGEVDVRVPPPFGPSLPSKTMSVSGVSRAARLGETQRLGKDDTFGEGAALTRYPVGIEVTAVNDVRCLFIKSQALLAMFDSEKVAPFQARFDQRYRTRVLRSHLQRVDLFANAAPAVMDALLRQCDLVNVKPDKPIATEGQPCEFFYFVRGGHLKLSVRTATAEVAVTYLRPGEWIGETAVVLNEAWPFTVTAIDHVELVRIQKDELQKLFPQCATDARVWEAMVSRLELRGRVHKDPRVSEPLQFAVDTGLIHGQSVLLIDLQRCTRCDECVRACADTHEGTPRFVREGFKFRNFTVPTACYHCADPVCMIGCPTGAISRPLGTKEVAVDASLCIGCGNCVNRCPWGNILTSSHEQESGKTIQLATKCDLCAGRAGGPACVQMCPQGCAERVDLTDEVEVTRLFAR